MKTSVGKDFLLVLLVLNNLIAFAFLGTTFLSGRPANKYTQVELFTRLAVLIVIISLFFSLISFGFAWFFRRSFGVAFSGLLRFFLFQFAFFVAGYLLMSFVVLVIWPYLGNRSFNIDIHI
jgi:hypothetical protein